MRIGLIGYGKMGKAIETIALERGHSISFISNSANPLDQVSLGHTDVAIEFSQPVLAFAHISTCMQHRLPIVVGTTAWEHQLEDVRKEVEQYKGALLHASNFSIGVNIFFQINERLAKLMGDHAEYKASIEEIHHLQKLDAPSGTAVTLANAILENHPGYHAWICGEGKTPDTHHDQLPVTALREPEVPGTHTIRYSSPIDTITITHEAHSRTGFALGAVIAAEFLFGKTGIYTMRDVLAL